jgi:putative sigma-54 modulation protein
MQTNIQSIHFNADQKLETFVREKVDKLNHFYDRIISSDVILRLEKSSTTDNKVAEIKIKIPGGDLFSKRQCKTFEEAVDEGLEAITRQVKRHKEKIKGV